MKEREKLGKKMDEGREDDKIWKTCRKKEKARINSKEKPTNETETPTPNKLVLNLKSTILTATTTLVENLAGTENITYMRSNRTGKW